MTETDDFRDFGFQQAKEPKFGEVAVGPALVVSASTSAFAGECKDSSVKVRTSHWTAALAVDGA
jgi:hypothetical protein